VAWLYAVDDLDGAHRIKGKLGALQLPLYFVIQHEATVGHFGDPAAYFGAVVKPHFDWGVGRDSTYLFPYRNQRPFLAVAQAGGQP